MIVAQTQKTVPYNNLCKKTGYPSSFHEKIMCDRRHGTHHQTACADPEGGDWWSGTPTPTGKSQNYRFP